MHSSTLPLALAAGPGKRLQGSTNQRDSAVSGRAQTLAVTLTLALGYVMAMLDATAVNVALDKIAGEFHAPLTSLVWVVDAYTLTFAALLLLGGAIADRLGAKRAYLLGLVWFIVASAVCALAGSTVQLIVARLFQGFGAALFMPSSMSLIGETFPDKVQRTRLVSVWGALVAAAAGIGPFFGGSLIELFGWRSIFYLNIPVGLLGIALSVLLLKPSAPHPRPFSVVSHALFMVALGSIAFVLIEGPTHHWFASRQILTATVVAMATLATIFARETTGRHPVVPAALRRNRSFWTYNYLGFSVNFMLFGEIFMLGLFLQQGKHLSPLATGVGMLPVIGIITIMSFLSARVSARIGATKTILAGFTFSGVGSLLTAAGMHSAPEWLLVVTLMTCNIGIGLATPAIVLGIIQEAGPESANVGSAMLNVNRQLGSLAGVAAMGILLHDVGDWSSSVRVGFLCFAVVIASAWGLTTMLIRRVSDGRTSSGEETAALTLVD
jgi:DHA2 family methylenomycin A resistance protein-like MFS transporter